MLVLEIAAGYLLGRLLLHLASILEATVIKLLLKHSSGFRSLIRKSRAEDEALKRDLRPSLLEQIEATRPKR